MSHSKAKWTPEEDKLLREGIKRYNLDWQKIIIFMKNTRTINSIIKRWHVKLKHEESMTAIKHASQRNLRSMDQQHASQEEEEEIKESSSHSKGRNWTEAEDKKLHHLIVNSGMLDWRQISKILDIGVSDVRHRWRKYIFPSYIQPVTQGLSKWSKVQDDILERCVRKDLDWHFEIKTFFPIRTIGSMKARWKRIKDKYPAIQPTNKNRHDLLKLCLRNIAKKEREQKQGLGKQQNLMTEKMHLEE